MNDFAHSGTRREDTVVKGYLATMICRCQPPVECGRKVSQSANNPNREYFTCVNPVANCNFFQWADTPVGGAMKAPRHTASTSTVVSNKIHIMLTVAEMFVDVDTPSGTATPAVKAWINVVVSIYIASIDIVS